MFTLSGCSFPGLKVKLPILGGGTVLSGQGKNGRVVFLYSVLPRERLN